MATVAASIDVFLHSVPIIFQELLGYNMNKADSQPSELLEDKFQVEMRPVTKGPQQETWKDRKQVAKSFFTTL